MDQRELTLKLNEYYKILASMHFDVLEFSLSEKHEAPEQVLNLLAALRVSKVFIRQLEKVLEEKPVLKIVKGIICQQDTRQELKTDK